MIPFRSNGDRRLNALEKFWFRSVDGLRRRLMTEVEVKDKNYRSIFVCENPQQAYRALSLWIKEEGTMRWINSELNEGDVFLDVGANIGIYTLAAAHRIGVTGQVYAVEPHKPNAISLMRNVSRNNFRDRVEVLTVALSDATGVAQFDYSDFAVAKSGSQLTSKGTNGTGALPSPKFSERCIGFSVDELLSLGAIAAPTFVKIDVDGLEKRILAGMTNLLTGSTRPKIVQVEINEGEGEVIEQFLKEVGYEIAERHYTLAGKRKLAQSARPTDVVYNAVFKPT
jgi:FkbM family methyltransferase